MDQQIKHNGIRMSATEVEDIAGGLNDLHETALIKNDQDDTLHLFVTTEDNLTVDVIFHFLNKNLSRHKVPNFIHKLAEFPRTQNGKIDRKKLTAYATTWRAND